MKRRRIFYFCPRGLSKHLHIYIGWVLEARKHNLPIYLITTIGIREYFKTPLIFRERGVILIPSLKSLDRILTTVFFLIQIIRNKLTVIHIRKRGTRIFEKLKKIFPNKLKTVIEYEGDLEYEYDYIRNHPYKNNYYSDIFNLKEKKYKIKRYKSSLLEADHILCVSENLKNLYISRDSIDESKITSITTGCDANRFRYSKEARNKYRKKLGLESNFVLIYVGSVYFSWQKISRSLKVYKLIKNIKENTKMIIITRESDKSILIDLIKRNNISPDNLMIKYSIPNEEISNYLNASDLGIILRDNHPMNNVAAPGKFGEYLCSGLPVLTGVGIADFSEKLANTSYGIVLDDINDDNELKSKFENYINLYEKINREEISLWGHSIFSFQEHINKYIETMKKLLIN